MIYNNEKIKSDLLEFLVTNIFNNFKNYIDSGDLIFTGGIVHDRVEIIKKERFHDLDISIIIGDYGDKILYELKDYLLNLDFTIFEDSIKTNLNNEFKFKEENNYLTACFYIDDFYGIDIYRDEYPEENISTVELYPNIYTKYYGNEWILRETFSTYKKMLSSNINNKTKKRKIDKIERTLVKIFNSINDFKDNELYNDTSNLNKFVNEVNLNDFNLNVISSSRSGHNFVMNNIKSWIKDINYNYTNIENITPMKFRLDNGYYSIQDNSINVIVVRDYLNWLASYLPLMKVNLINYRDGYDDSVLMNEMNQQIKIWCETVKEFYGETNYVNNKVLVIYDDFFTLKEYRENICDELNGDYNEDKLNEVAINGYYSSFDVDKFDGNANEMKVDERYLQILDTEYHDIYLKILMNNQEALDLYFKYFNLSDNKKEFINNLNKVKLIGNNVKFNLNTPYEKGANNMLKYVHLIRNYNNLNTNELLNEYKNLGNTFIEFKKNQEKKKNQLYPYIEISKSLGDNTNYKIANFGCGSNYFSELRKNDSVIGLDFIAMDNNVIECDIANTPLENNSFDVVVVSSINADNYLDVLKEAHRVLKTNGILKISEQKNNSIILKMDLFDLGFNNITSYIKSSYVFISAKK